jgi:hypothetical protein
LAVGLNPPIDPGDRHLHAVAVARPASVVDQHVNNRRSRSGVAGRHTASAELAFDACPHVGVGSEGRSQDLVERVALLGS